MSRRQRHYDTKSDFQFLNKAQEYAWDTIADNDVTFLLGPAGTAKTFIPTAYAVRGLIANQYEKFMITRPIVEAGENLGALPGDYGEKTAPYMHPINAAITKLSSLFHVTEASIKKCVEVRPLAYLRGTTFENSFCLLDEAQNTTFEQMLMYLTRFGQGSKVVIAGDSEQTDIGSGSVLETFAMQLEDIKGIGVYRFEEEDIVRHQLVGRIVQRMRGVRR